MGQYDNYRSSMRVAMPWYARERVISNEEYIYRPLRLLNSSQS